MKILNLKTASLICLTALLAGCNKQANILDHVWTPPVKITDSIENLVGWVYLYKTQGTIMCLQPLENGATRCFFLTNNSWVESHFMSLPKGYDWGDLAIDQEGRTVMLPDGNIGNRQLVMKALLGTFAESGIRVVLETTWETDKKTLFEETNPNVQFGETNRYGRGSIYYGKGIISNSEIYLPYCASAVTVTSHTEHGPFNNGVFHSTNAGKTWQIERISDFDTWVPAICKTKDYYYYFGCQYNYWFSRKPAEGGKWDAPKEMTKTFTRSNWRGSYIALAERDAVYACWMDCRHNMWRFNIDGPPIENNDIFYCHRKDSDSGWSKDVILSKGLLYSYPPSMSVEGDTIVVAWSGISSAGKHHDQYDPNDIYYVTSKDGGKTWLEPLKVTDQAKDGVVSGRPQVMLLNGVIHLFYIQGKIEKAEPLSPGLTKLNGVPWPIYYTQRPFPN
jgi:hypothetical protein